MYNEKAPEYTSERISEMKLVSWITQKFNDSKTNFSARQKFDEECHNAYHRVFDDAQKPDWASKHTTNYIKTTIEAIRPILTDNNPQFQILPRTESGVQYIDQMQMLMDYEWDRSEMYSILPKVMLTSLIQGTGVVYLKWDKKDGKQGNVKPIVVDPRKIYPDPMATSVDDAQYIMYADWISVKDLKDSFPSRANEIHSQSIVDNQFVTTPLVTPQPNMALVLEVWMRDNTYVDVEENIDGNTVKIKKKKYPRGRVITCLPQSGIILSDRSNPYLHGKFPFILFKDYDIPFEFWGRGDVEHLLSPQKYMDELNNAIIDNAKHTANTIWVIDKNSGIPKGSLKNREGLVIRKNPGTEVSRPTPPSMPSYVQYKVEEFKADIENIAGVHDVTKGKATGGITAAQAIMALQEAGQARIRLKVKIMEYALTRMANMWLDVISQYWTDDRIVRVVDANGRYSSTPITTAMLKDKYDVKITAGSTMPSNRNAMLDMMLRLSQTMAEDGLPLTDREAMVEFMPISMKRGLLDRFKERKQTQEDQIAEQYQQQVEQLMQVVTDLQKEVDSMAKEHDKQRMEKAKMEDFNKGYQAAQSGANLTDEQKYGIIQGEKKIPDELIEEIQSLPDEELAKLLEMVPDLEQILANNA